MTSAESRPSVSCEYRVDEGVAVVTLDRPDRLNALSHDLLKDLKGTLAQLDSDSDVGAVVITGEGRAFSSGADLQGPPSDAEDVVRRLYIPLITSMAAMETPLVAAVNGVTAGAAVALALACDLRVADESAYFQVSFSKVGLVPDAGLTWLLPRAIGTGRARRMTLLAERVPADVALDWGLVDEVTSPGQSVDRALHIAKTLADMPSIVGRTRKLMHDSMSRSFDEQLDAEATAQGLAQHGHDFQEVRSAFREKRKPVFRIRRA